MLNIASMVLASWLWLHSQFHGGAIPMPVVIVQGESYDFDLIYSAITVPSSWEGTCADQKRFMWYMEKYYNGQLNGNHKKSEEQLIEIRDKWVCVQ